MNIADRIADSPNVQLVLLGLAAIAVIVIGTRLISSLVQRNPEKRERRRRKHLNETGRLADGFITDASDSVIYYSYSVQGVQYETSQDISLFREKLPAEPDKLIGLTNLKYAVNNPGNSILLCEDWSGLRPPPRREEHERFIDEGGDAITDSVDPEPRF